MARGVACLWGRARIVRAQRTFSRGGVSVVLCLGSNQCTNGPRLVMSEPPSCTNRPLCGLMTVGWSS